MVVLIILLRMILLEVSFTIFKNARSWGKRYLLSGYSYDMKELAAILSEASGTEIKYEPVSLETFAEMYDEPKGFGALLASMYNAGARTINQESNDFQQLVNDQPQTLQSFLQENI